MSALFLHQLEAIFGWILAASWQASVLALLVLLLQKALGARLNPRWRYALWLLVLARLVLPALPESAWSLFQFAPLPPPALVEPVTEPLFVAAPLPAPQIELPEVEPRYPFSVFSLLAVAWLTGAVALLFLTWQVNRRFARQIADSPAINDPELLQLFATAKAELNVTRSIRLVENSQVQSPAIMGLFRPTLLLPANVRDKFDARELRFIFLHELAHLKRGDVIAQAVIALLQIVHWFNPVLWFAFRRMRIDREPATDALVLSRTGESEKESYGLMLIKLLEHFNQRHSLPTLVGILEDKDQFKRRFSLIAKFTRGAYGWSLLGILLIALLAVACLTKSKPEKVKTPENEYEAHLKNFKPEEQDTLRKAFGIAESFVMTMDARPLTNAGATDHFDEKMFKIPSDASDTTRVRDKATWLTVIDGAHSRFGRVQSRHLKNIGYSGNSSQGPEFLHDVFVKYEVTFQKGNVSTTMLENLDLIRTPTYDPQGQWIVYQFFIYDPQSLAAAASKSKLTGWVDTPAPYVAKPPTFASKLSFENPDVSKMVFASRLSLGKNDEAPQGFARVEVLAIKLPESDYQAKRTEIDDAVQQGHYLAVQDTPHARAIFRGYLPVTKWGQPSGLVTGPTNPSLMFRCTSTPEQGGSIKLTGDLTVNQSTWTDRSGATPQLDLSPIGTYPLDGTLLSASSQFQAIPKEGIRGPLTKEGPGDKVPYRLFLFFKVWPQQEASVENSSQPSTNAPSPDQKALTDAVQKGDAAVVQKLIDAGADPKAVEKDGTTLLFHAGSSEVAELLIAKGVDPKAANNLGTTALSSICIDGGKNTAAIARVLLKHGADPNARSGQLQTTPIMGCIDGDTVDVLVEYGADPKAKDNKGDDALFWATWQSVSTVEALIRHGATFDPKTEGPTLLMYAVQNNNVPVATWLLDHGVDPNLKGTWDKKGDLQSTPLQVAATDISIHDREAIMTKLLLDHGAKVTNEMAYALNNQHPQIVKIFWERGARTISDLTYQISQGASLADVRKLLDQGTPVDPIQDPIMPLAVAAGLGRMDLVQLLIQRGADVNKGAPLNPQYPDYSLTPLVSAAQTGQDEIVDYLLVHGAQPTPKATVVATNRSVSFPGQRTKEHFEQCVKFLIGAGALKKATPEQAGELLSGAMLTGGMGGNATVLKMLLDAGLSPESPMPGPIPYPDDTREKGMSVLAYYQDFYAKRQNSYRYAAQLKPLLDMLEAADKSTGLMKVKSAAETTISVDFKDVSPSIALLEIKSMAAKKGFAFDLDLSAVDKNAPAITLKTNEASVEDTIGYICRMVNLQCTPLEKSNGYRISSLSESPLLKAIKAKDEKTAIQLVADGADISATDESGNGALVNVFMYGWGTPRLPLNLLESLLAHTKDPNPNWSSPNTNPVSAPIPLFEEVIAITGAIQLSDADRATYRQAIKMLLDHGATFSQVPDAKTRTLLLSATHGDLPAIQQAIQQGASINAANGNGWTALAISLALGYDDCSHWLLDHGANTFGEIKPYYDPLKFAVRQGKTELVEKMIAHGAKTEANDFLLQHAILQNNQRLFDALIKAGATGKEGSWMFNVVNGIKYRMPDSVSLYLCIKNNQTAMAKTLLETGAIAEPPTMWDNRNLAYWAVSFDRPEILRLLLAHGANPLLKSRGGETALSLAQKSHPDLVPILNAAIQNPETAKPVPLPAPTTSTQDAVGIDNSIASLPADLTPTPYPIPKPSLTALHKAIMADNSDQVKALLEQGATPYVIQAGALKGASDDQAATYLLLAFKSGNPTTLKQLLSAGLSLRSKRDQGEDKGKTAIEIIREDYARTIALDPTLTAQWKPLLDMVEAANKNTPPLVPQPTSI